MCFYMLKRKYSLEPTTAGQNIFLTTADLKLCRLPSRSPLPFAALPSVSLLPAAPLADDRIRVNKGETEQNKAQVILLTIRAIHASHVIRVIRGFASALLMMNG
jgi:hypothetical protein